MLCNTFRSHAFIYVDICNAFTVASPNLDESAIWTQRFNKLNAYVKSNQNPVLFQNYDSPAILFEHTPIFTTVLQRVYTSVFTCFNINFILKFVLMVKFYYYVYC